MSDMNGAKLVLECLKKQGVDTLFGYPGGAVIPLYDALYDYRDDFKHIRTSHEQGLVHAADGYARSTGKVGVCIVTSGPGATNAVTGIATAYMDSTPMVVISGQVPTSMLGIDSFQEVDITGIALSVTKHTYLLRSVDEIIPTINEAFKIAQSGRKGPVLIDIPKDLFTSGVGFDMADFEEIFKEASLNKYDDFDFPEDEDLDLKIDEAVNLILNSKKPVIYAGGGVKNSSSEDELKLLAESFNIPVVNTLMGLGNFDRNSRLSLGLMGMHGFREANFAITKSDLLIAVGSRFSDRGTGLKSAFAKDAKIVHIEIDRSEIEKNIKCDLPLIGSSKKVLDKLYKRLNTELKNSGSVLNFSSWLEEIHSYSQDDGISNTEFHPKNILNLTNNILGKNKETVVATDVGQHQMWAAQHWKFSQGLNFITSGGLGTMGFGMGASIGAAVGNPDKNTVLVTGDGSFKMNLNELATLRDYNLPVTILLFNNNALGMVRQWQKLFSDERYSETDISSNIDYMKLAQAFGIKSHRVSDLDSLETVLCNLDTSSPTLIECDINKNYDVFPIVPPNDVLENLILG